ncbi:MAG TPA: Crp/Fnr family transcriptional regulator [Abditibacteriaceae bacterium]|jgi:CRP/FNR family cyclic AMP-dependent transcriptional regulator
MTVNSDADMPSCAASAKFSAGTPVGAKPVGADPAQGKPPSRSVLRDTALFCNLPDEHLSEISQLLCSKVLPVGTDVLTVKNPGDHVYILIEGSVKMYLKHADGSDVILGILGRGEVLGEVSGVDGKCPSANVATLEKSYFLCIERHLLWKLMQTMPILGYNVACILARRLRVATAQIHSFATLDVDGRVARQLLAFAHEYGRKDQNGGVLIPLQITQTDLADLVGASRVRVNRVLMEFKKHSYVSTDANHRITLRNIEALRERCHSLA